MKNATGTPNLAQENQAIKRQKLEGGRSREVTFTSVILLKYRYYFYFCFLSEPLFVYIPSTGFPCVPSKYRFLIPNPKHCPTSQNWVILACILQLL